MDKNIYTPQLFSDAELDPLKPVESGPVQCLGMEFENEEARREYFRDELRRKLPELRQIEGFPIGEDEDIIRLSDPPYYTACPNPWLNDFIQQWEEEKKDLILKGKRSNNFNIEQPFASDVSEGKNEPIYNAHSYHTKVPPKAIKQYLSYYTQPGDIVLDSFSGSGMTGVACKNYAVRDNMADYRNVILNDLSPAATNLTYNNTTPVDLEKFRNEATNILVAAEEKYAWMFKTKDPETGKVCDAEYYVWSEISSCENCSTELKFSEIAFEDDFKSLKKDISCPKCGCVINKRKIQPIIEIAYDKELDSNISKPLREISLICYKINGRKFYKKPDNNDYIISKTVDELPMSGIKTVAIPDMQMMRVGRMKASQIKYIHQFYFEKTKYILNYMWMKACEISDIRIQNLVKYWLDSQFVNLSYRNRYRPNVSFPYNPMTGVFYIPMMSCESNPFVAYKNKLGKIIEAFKTINNTDKCSIITNSSASDIPLKSNSIDYIFTDPPFGENIYYSDLNYFIEAWNGIFTNTSSEAIVDKVKNKTVLTYNKLIENCFKEYFRVLKPGKWITVVFSNTSASIWNGIQQALKASGFIVANVSSLDKQQGTFQAVNTTTAVVQDLVISCYKPSERIQTLSNENPIKNVWDFVEDFIAHLVPPHISEGKIYGTGERSERILFDKVISYFVQRGYSVPMDSIDFQKGLRERFIERDNMFFTASQALEYEELRKHASEVIPMGLVISNEAEGIAWLNRKLEIKYSTYQELQPEWMKDMIAPKKGDIIPELLDILEENFIKDEDGYWRKPDAEKAADLEALRLKRMAKEFALYLEQARKPKAKRMKDCRLEVLRYGFKDCYKRKDYEAIIAVGDHIQESLLLEDEILLQYYDSAAERV